MSALPSDKQDKRGSMAQTQIRLAAHIAWWLRPYLRLVVVACWLTRREPNMDKVAKVIGKAITVKAATE